jgi:hypothetical protein
MHHTNITLDMIHELFDKISNVKIAAKRPDYSKMSQFSINYTPTSSESSLSYHTPLSSFELPDYEVDDEQEEKIEPLIERIDLMSISEYNTEQEKYGAFVVV